MAYEDYPTSGWFGGALTNALAAAGTVDPADTYHAHLWSVSATGTCDPYGDNTLDSGFWTLNHRAATGAVALTSVSTSGGPGYWHLISTDTNLVWTEMDDTLSGILIVNNTNSDEALGFINFGSGRTVSGSYTYTPDPTYGWLSISY